MRIVHKLRACSCHAPYYTQPPCTGRVGEKGQAWKAQGRGVRDQLSHFPDEVTSCSFLVSLDFSLPIHRMGISMSKALPKIAQSGRAVPATPADNTLHGSEVPLPAFDQGTHETQRDGHIHTAAQAAGQGGCKTLSPLRLSGCSPPNTLTAPLL